MLKRKATAIVSIYKLQNLDRNVKHMLGKHCLMTQRFTKHMTRMESPDVLKGVRRYKSPKLELNGEGKSTWERILNAGV